MRETRDAAAMLIRCLHNAKPLLKTKGKLSVMVSPPGAAAEHLAALNEGQTGFWAN